MANDPTLNPVSTQAADLPAPAVPPTQPLQDPLVAPLPSVSSQTATAVSNAPYSDAAMNQPTDLPAAGEHETPAFQVPLSPATQPLVPVEPIATRLSDAWLQEQASPIGQVNPAVMPALPDAAVFASSAPQEMMPPSAAQLPHQAAEAHPHVIEQVTGQSSSSDLSLPLTPSVAQDETVSAASDLLPVVEELAQPVAESTPDVPPAVGEETPADDEKKTPLEILEEILAGANAEKDLKEKEELEKKEKEEQEKAAFAAKEAEFKLEAEKRLAENAAHLQEAKEQRQHVEEELAEKNPVVAIDDTLTINQLTRDTIETNE